MEYDTIYNPKSKQKARKLRKQGTLSEIILWNKLKNKQLKYKFRRQVPIDKYIVDFYCPSLKLIIEIDGSSHGDKIKYDKERENKLKSLDLKILKFTDTSVKQNLEEVLENISETIKTLP